MTSPTHPDSSILQWYKILRWYKSTEQHTLYYGPIQLGWILSSPLPGPKWSAFDSFREFIGTAPTPEEAQRLVEQAALNFTQALSAALSAPKEPA